ncbi:MAG: hypothetical protein HOH43_17730 [Candidatus Latescibacteria bacterium]|jgi:hypothetical protein|nr:hypothetical protein [Candidatus Latescibacterota bacterium]
MVLIYRGFEGSRVFKWARGNKSHVTVMFPAEPFFDRCVERVMQEFRSGNSVLAWGDPDGLALLGSVLRERGIQALSFGETAPRRRSSVRKRAAYSTSLL